MSLLFLSRVGAAALVRGMSNGSSPGFGARTGTGAEEDERADSPGSRTAWKKFGDTDSFDREEHASVSWYSVPEHVTVEAGGADSRESHSIHDIIGGDPEATTEHEIFGGSCESSFYESSGGDNGLLDGV